MLFQIISSAQVVYPSLGKTEQTVLGAVSRLYVRMTVKCRKCLPLTIHNLWTEISTQNSEFYVAIVYHPPNPEYNDQDLIEFFIDSCEQLLSAKPN